MGKGKDLPISPIPSFEQNVVDISGNPRKRGIKRLGQKLFALLEELKDSLMKADTEKSFDDEMEEVYNLMANNMYVRIANTFVNSDMGLIDNQASTLLDTDFQYIPPFTDSLNKNSYMKYIKTLNMRKGFPDLDWRPHDFRIDNKNENKVFFTTRAIGTNRGLILVDETLIEPTGKRIEFPPESHCLEFDPETKKIIKYIGGGLVMDRTIGNTMGLGGEYGIAAGLGYPVSVFKHTPPQKVVGDFLSRSPKKVKQSNAMISPLPEPVLYGLTRTLIENDFATPGLLSNDFSFVGPLVGPLDKDTFLKAFTSFNIRKAFPDLKYSLNDLRVDPFDKARVWLSVRSSGTFTGTFGEGKNSIQPNGAKFESGVEAISMTFNANGQLDKLTVGVLLDPTEGNTGGLGGVFGILEGVGNGLPGIATKPLQVSLRETKSNIVKSITSPFKSALGKTTDTSENRSTSKIPAKPIKMTVESKEEIKNVDVGKDEKNVEKKDEKKDSK